MSKCTDKHPTDRSLSYTLSGKKNRVKSGNFGHQVNSDIHWQTVEIQMRRLPMSRLIRVFSVCLVNLFLILIIKI